MIESLTGYIMEYANFAEPGTARLIALWIAGTYCFESFDAYPYLCITAKVKRCGKTRLSELIGFTCNMPFPVAGVSAPSLFRKIKEDKPTILWDEAEQLSSEASSLLRAFLNVGYRKGQSIPRFTTNGVVEWPTYCPKVFVTIGDVYDTLRDRSLIVEMRRGEPVKRFSYDVAKTEGAGIGLLLRAEVENYLSQIQSGYQLESVPFLSDREEEIWRPIFAICRALDPSHYAEIRRMAADMSALKTNPERYTENVEHEKKAQMEEYGLRLLRDMALITKDCKAISSGDALTALKNLDVAPWRKYLGAGLDAITMSRLLTPYGLRPKIHRIGTAYTGKGQHVVRGYSQADVLKSLKLHTLAKKAGA